MLLDVRAVNALPDYKLHLIFENGVEGIVDFRECVPFKGVFEPMKDPEYFAQVKVHPELGSICWPNNADMDTMVLYAKVTGNYNVLLGESHVPIDWRDYLTIDYKNEDGELIVKGTDIKVSSILEMLSNGFSIDDVLFFHTGLTEKNIRACFMYGAEQAKRMVDVNDFVVV